MPVRADLDRCRAGARRVAARAARALRRERDAEPDGAPLLPLAVAPRQQVAVPRDLERAVEHWLVVAVHVWGAGRSRVGELVGRDEVAAAQLNGVEGQLLADEVEHALDAERGLRLPGAPVGRDGRAVGHEADLLAVVGGDVVRAREALRRVVRRRERPADPVRAEVRQEARPDGEDGTRVRDGGIHVRLQPARVRRVYVLAAFLHPLHRTLQPPRQEDGRDLFRVDVVLVPEAAAHVRRDDAHVARHRQRLLDVVLRVVRRLVGRPEREVAGRVETRDAAPALHRHRREARDDERGGDDPVGGCERAVHVASSRTLRRSDVRPDHGMERGIVAVRCTLQVVDGLQRLVDDLDAGGGVGGLRGGLRCDGCDGLPCVERPPQREDGVRAAPVDLHPRPADALQHRAFLDVVRRDDGEHTRHRESLARVDAVDARMRVWAADDGAVRHAGQRHVGDELAVASEQAVVLQAGDRLSGVGGAGVGCCRSHGRDSIVSVVRSCFHRHSRTGGNPEWPGRPHGAEWKGGARPAVYCATRLASTGERGLSLPHFHSLTGPDKALGRSCEGRNLVSWV